MEENKIADAAVLNEIEETEEKEEIGEIGETEEIREIFIDGAEISNRVEFYESMKRQLPEGYLIGHNLDALHDALTTVSSFTRIHVIGEEILENNLGPYWNRIRKVMEASEDENYNITADYADK